MKGFITKTLNVVCLAGGLMSLGCLPNYHNVVDPCYPQRYIAMARKDVEQHLAPQVQNGHILDQTMWNSHFENGTAKLTPGGLEHLQYLVRRRPAPDTIVYVQSAQDVTYDPAAPEKYVEARRTLNAERVASVQKFLTVEADGRNLNFNVVVHDPAAPQLHGATVNNTSRLRILSGPGGTLPSTSLPSTAPAVQGNTGSWQ